MEVLDVVLSDSALCAHLIDEARDEPHGRVGDIVILGVLKAALCVEAFCHTSCNAVRNTHEHAYVRKVLYVVYGDVENAWDCVAGVQTSGGLFEGQG